MTKDQEIKKPSEESATAAPTHSYMKDWTPGYLETAEFELVVQKQLLPVHKHVLSMSPFFQRELFKTESKKSLLVNALKKKEETRVSTRLKLSTTLFQDISVKEMCLLLSHVYATEAQLSTERMDELRSLFRMTEEFEFHTLTKRCVNFMRVTDGAAAGIQTDLEGHGTTAASEWLELAVKWDFPPVKDIVCEYAGEHFFEIYGREGKTKPSREWADLVLVLESDIELWKRLARSQATRIEAGPSLSSLICDEPSTALIYGVLAGIIVGSILPSWMFFLILIGTIWYVFNRMPPALLIVIRKTVEGALHGIFHGEGKENDPSDVPLQNSKSSLKAQETLRRAPKPPVLKRSSRITA